MLLSGYQEFEYAQKAVRFQAFDYLLKPVSFEKMSALLGKLEILCRNRAYLKKRDQLSGLIEGNGEASAAQADCVTLLVNAGAMPLTSDDLGAPGRKFWRGVQLEELLRSIVPERDSVLPFSGKSKTERIVVIETRSPDSARAAIETLYRRLTEMTPLPITVAARVEPVPISEVAQTISDLRTLLYREIRLCASQLLWDAPGGARRPGKAIPLSSFPVNRVVEAICGAARSSFPPRSPKCSPCPSVRGRRSSTSCACSRQSSGTAASGTTRSAILTSRRASARRCSGAWTLRPSANGYRRSSSGCARAEARPRRARRRSSRRWSST